jgi:hypothetical protein
MKHTDNTNAGAIEIRQTLKNIFFEQLEHLPASLGELSAKDRLDYLLKLMPYIVPRVKDVFHTNGED